MERERGREIVGEGSSMSSREQRNLREQERRMLTSASTYRTSDIIHDSIEREVSIPGIQPYKMNLTMDLNMKRVMLYQLLNVFEEEGAQVMNANLQKLNDRVIILYNHSPAFESSPLRLAPHRHFWLAIPSLKGEEYAITALSEKVCGEGDRLGSFVCDKKKRLL
uniref:Uncharacterized protein n=1 Tax=Brassica oleracea TaxID=3712 RepID=A0A3P6GPM8_BRAOL|nr:unnamed protein product [Brassica oleracea]